MANFVSPGVYIVEKDISDYPASVNSSVVGIVGFADRGPVAGLNEEKATLITSQEQLIQTFGEPSEDIKGQALEGSLEILEATTSLRFVRAADTAVAAEASAIVPLGGCPAFWVSGSVSHPIRLNGTLGMMAIGSASAASVGSETSSVKFIATVVDDDLVSRIASKTYDIPVGTTTNTYANGATTIAALTKVFGGSLDADNIGAFGSDATNDASSYVCGLQAGSGAYLTLSAGILTDEGVYEPLPCLVPVGVDGGAVSALTESVNGDFEATTNGVSIDTSGVQYVVQSLYPGAGYNLGTKSNGDTSGVSFEVSAAGAGIVQTQVNDLGVAAESFKIGLLSGASFAEEAIGINVLNKTSDYITAEFHDDDSTFVPTALTSFTDSLVTFGVTDAQGAGGGDNADGNAARSADSAGTRFLKPIQGTYGLSSGDSGIPTATADVQTAIIGSVKTDGGRTGIEALDDDVLNISIALTPGVGVGDNQAIQNALITKAEETKNFLACVSPPYAVGKTGDAIDWANGFADTRTAAINSSYAAIYWPWVKVFQVFDGKDRWLAPEIFAARQMGVTDAVADPWFAPAGFVRGRLTKPTDVEVILNQGDRDSLYSGGNVINPIVNFPQRGIAIFGQRTAQRSPTALDRVNVRRMMIYIKKVLLASTQRLVFEPNDQFTWNRVEQLCNPLLDDIARRRGITQFKVICDESINTPVRVDRNEMWCKIMIKPTKTAEIVIFELNLTSQSASF